MRGPQQFWVVLALRQGQSDTGFGSMVNLSLRHTIAKILLDVRSTRSKLVATGWLCDRRPLLRLGWQAACWFLLCLLDRLDSFDK